MTPSEYKALPADLQRDVRLALALGYALKAIRGQGRLEVPRDYGHSMYWHGWRPTQDKTVWAALLEAFPIHVAPRGFGNDFNGTGVEVYEVWPRDSEKIESTMHASLPVAVVASVINADPIGHLAAAMKELG
jgi:hypothetical protein